MSFSRKNTYFLTNLAKLSSLFCFSRMSKSQNLDLFFCCFFFLLLSFFPLRFFFMSGFVANFIVFLLHGTVAG